MFARLGQDVAELDEAVSNRNPEVWNRPIEGVGSSIHSLAPSCVLSLSIAGITLPALLLPPQVFLQARSEDPDKAIGIQRQMKALKKYSRV
jgi:hypothetical protein